MGGDLCCAGRLEDALGLGHLAGCAVSDDEELVRLEGRLVLHYAVFRNPECCTQLSLFDCYLIHEASPSNIGRS